MDEDRREGDGGKWKPEADRNMWQRLGGYPKAIVGRNPSGARERPEGGSIFETRKKGWWEKRIPTLPIVCPSFPPRRLQKLAAQSVGELFCSAV